MLSQLYIENIAVIEKAQIDFTYGFNVFSGETGAGKSILINSINAIMGERFSKDLIRKGETKATVTAVFSNISDVLKSLLEDMGYDIDDELLIYRSISEDGKNVCKINARPANVSILKDIAEYLVNIHGQHDNQAILNPARHIDYIDAYGETADILAEYKAKFSEYKKISKQFGEASSNLQDKSQKIDFLTFQIDEILGANITVGEEAELIKRRDVIKNSEHILRALNRAYLALQGDDDNDGAVSLLEDASRSLEEPSEYISDIDEVYSRIEEIKYELRDFADTIYSEMDNVEYDPRELENIEDRLDVIYKLKKKYGNSEEEILDFLNKAQAQLDLLTDGENSLDKLSEKLEKAKEESQKLADILSKKRKNAAEDFSKNVMNEVAFLNMPDVRISVDFKNREMAATGIDDVEFLISVNAGEDLKPLSKVASGGELSRIMLAIKNVLAKHDFVLTLIFDEIDTGVSGRAADKIGQKLKDISNNKQVLCVTHLAQIAAFADTHFLIEKTTKDARTFTSVNKLDFDGRKQELARIMSGSNVTEIALENAAQMLYSCNK
jgi:DNA repair protein RecN (Recombination protein N)